MPLTPISNIGQNLADRLKVADIASTSADLRRWLDSDFGRYLQARERQVFQEQFAELPGYRFMRLGLSEDPSRRWTVLNRFTAFSLHPAELRRRARGPGKLYAELPLEVRDHRCDAAASCAGVFRVAKGGAWPRPVECCAGRSSAALSV